LASQEGVSALERIVALGDSHIARLAKGRPDIAEIVQSSIDEWASALSGTHGQDLLVDTIGAPTRLIHLADREVHLGAYDSAHGLQIVMITWPAERRDDKTLRTLGPADVDEFVLPGDEYQFVQTLRSLAADTNFQPIGGLRVGALISDRVKQLMPNAPTEIAAAIAVAGGQTTLYPVGDPNDSAYLRRLERTIHGSSHQAIATMSLPKERWVMNVLKTSQRGRAHIRLDFGDLAVASDQAAYRVAAAAAAAPPYPTLEWGDEACRRIEGRESPALGLTEQAKRHLRRNKYPDVERMLGRLEALADLAEAWNLEGIVGARFEDWAASHTTLRLAMSDGNISAKDAKFVFEGKELDNRPHVKVDDNTSPSHCGRIYFGIDGATRRIVVDIVGLHDRY
jgi:hypothetical protein